MLNKDLHARYMLLLAIQQEVVRGAITLSMWTGVNVLPSAGTTSEREFDFSAPFFYMLHGHAT